MITHYRRGSTTACTARIRPPWLTGETTGVDCGNCIRTDAYKNSIPAAVSLPPVPTETRPAAADVPVLRAWLERTG